MRRKITIGLSVREINKAIAEVAKMKADLNLKINKLILALTEAGVEIAKAEIRGMGAKYTGELESSIEGFFNSASGTGIIKAGAWYAVYVEFGTGIIGENSPHPSPKGWQYDINDHGEEGWFYLNSRDSALHWTQGMKSRPFMYNTARQLEQECNRIAKEVFGRD